MKKYLIFLIICILGYMSAFAIGYAEWGNKKIEVEYRNISIIVNGKKIQTDVEPFIYNGRTFVPVRWVAEALDKKVGWNGDTWTVYIDDKKPSEKSPLKFGYLYRVSHKPVYRESENHKYIRKKNRNCRGNLYPS